MVSGGYSSGPYLFVKGFIIDTDAVHESLFVELSHLDT